MIAPDWVCRELARVHPRVRLGWAGRERAEGQLNAGSFMLLELLSARQIDHTFRSAWADRGPVYGPDYDRLSWVPVMIYDVSPEDVFSGRVVHMLRRWMTPISQRTRESWEQRERQYRSEIREIAEAAGDELYWRAHHDSNGGIPQVAKKFVTPEEKARLTGDWQANVATDKAPAVSPVAVL